MMVHDDISWDRPGGGGVCFRMVQHSTSIQTLIISHEEDEVLLLLVSKDGHTRRRKAGFTSLCARTSQHPRFPN